MMYFKHLDVLCNLVANRHTTAWNLFVLYNRDKIRLAVTVAGFVQVTYFLRRENEFLFGFLLFVLFNSFFNT